MIRRIRIISLAALFLCLAAAPVAAVSTVDCHCFRDREFSAHNPKAFDPYLLATVQNRLMAHAFGVPRKEIVRMKMTGDQGDRLWVALWMAKTSSRQLNEIKAVYARSKSWQKSIAELSVKPEALGDFFAASLAEEDEGSLAWAVVMQISDHYMPTPDDFIELKSRGASLKEAILATVLAQLKEDSAVNVFEQAMKDGHWGGQLVASKLTVESLEKFLDKSFSSR